MPHTEAPRTVVLTGGPHSGKTTLVERLRDRGHAVVPEAAYALIDELNGELGVEGQRRWRQANLLEFQARVLRRQCDLEARHLARTDAPVVFLDRGRPDGFAYCTIRGVTPTEEMHALVAARRYDHVVLLDLVLPFDPRPASGRYGDRAAAEESTRVLARVYADLGYTPRRLAQLDVEERVERLLAWYG